VQPDLHAIGFKQKDTLQSSFSASPPWILDRPRVNSDSESVDILDSFGIKVKIFADHFKLYLRIINEVDVTTLQEALIFFT